MPKSLRQATSEAAVCKLKYYNFSHDDFTIMSDGRTVWLIHQRAGNSVNNAIAIPKRTFDRLYDKYGKPQPIVPKKR